MLPLIDAGSKELLLANGRNREADHYPVVKLFNPAGGRDLAHLRDGVR